MFRGIHFPLSIVPVAFQKFWCVSSCSFTRELLVVFVCLFVASSLLISFLAHWLFRRVLFNLHIVFVNCPIFSIALQSYTIVAREHIYIISILLHFRWRQVVVNCHRLLLLLAALTKT